jgi:16S rRNA processing protein RimM
LVVDERADTDRVLLGRIASAHGIRGEVLIHAYTTMPEGIAAYGPLSDKDGSRTFRIVSVRATAKGIVARLDGVNDRTAAEALAGLELFIRRNRLPATAEDEFYHADLVGLAVVDPEGKVIGRVQAVQNFGAGDLLEVQLEGTGKSELIPFTEAAVPEVDLTVRRVVVVLPPTTDVDDDTGGSSA